MAFCRQLRSQSTRLSDIVYDGDPVVLEFIGQGIDAANAEVTSDSAKIMKWTILRTDFSVAGGELGERGRARKGPAAGAHSQAPDSCSLKRHRCPGHDPGHLRFSAAPPRNPAGGRGGGPQRGSPCRMDSLGALWDGATVPPLLGPLNPSLLPFRPQAPPCIPRTDLAHEHLILRGGRLLQGVEGRSRLARDSVTGATTKLKRAMVARIYQAEIENLYEEDDYDN